jgi:hypothetical protein
MSEAALAEPPASKQTRARWSSFGPIRKPLKVYDWAEPGDPPCADFASVRADPIAKTIPVDSLTREVELELIRRYRQDGDIEALDWLVGAHRPMVVRMARGRWRGNGTSLAALVEYGMFGLRLAAEPPCASQTKNGELVGFDPSKGHRFSTYARHYADKEMRAALASDPGPAIKSDEFPKAAVVAESWHTAPSSRGILPDTPPAVREMQAGLFVLATLQQATVIKWVPLYSYLKPQCPWTLWTPPAWHRPQKPRPRNFIKHPRTETENANRAAHYGRSWEILKGYEAAAKDGMEFDSQEYRLPDNVLRQRWRMGCKRQGKIIPFMKNQGLGLFDKKGHSLPIYPTPNDEITRVRSKTFTPFLCRYPLASIYLVGGEITGQEGEVISRRRGVPELTAPNQQAVVRGGTGTHPDFCGVPELTAPNQQAVVRGSAHSRT